MRLPRALLASTFKRTLDVCQECVDRFIAFNKPGAIAVRRWLSIGKYAFDYDSIKPLQLEAAGHVQDIIVIQNNLTLATLSELLKRNKEIERIGEPTSTTFQLNLEIDELAAHIEAILARTLLPPLPQDVTDNCVEMPSGAGENMEENRDRHISPHVLIVAKARSAARHGQAGTAYVGASTVLRSCD
ncbi:MAG: hypothetical protein M1832_005188 [Thelocarpon impressellum]|nr:MAG: hypothetical protein M1832_005188 [Thelocarpon impressellum]